MTVTTEPEPWTGRVGVDLAEECGARTLRLELQVEVTRIRVFCDRRELDDMNRAAFKEWLYRGRRPSKAGGWCGSANHLTERGPQRKGGIS